MKEDDSCDEVASALRQALISFTEAYGMEEPLRSDPFFFDTIGALNNLQFTGDDFFADKDMRSIVLEIPTLPAIDVFLSILTNGKVTRDNVGPHTDPLTSFAYVASPHKIRSAERVAA